MPKKAKPERTPALLLLLLAGFVALAWIPDDQASVRVAGMSLLWWYGGLIAPTLAVVLAVLTARSPREPPHGAPDPPPSLR